jgi:hypothetical protein
MFRSESILIPLARGLTVEMRTDVKALRGSSAIIERSNEQARQGMYTDGNASLYTYILP